MKKYSKSLGDISAIEKSFASNNDDMLGNANRLNNSYRKQSLRRECKTCHSPLSKDVVDFINHGIEYIICTNCGHLNGIYEDSDDFCYQLYVADGGSNYSQNYLKGYSARVQNIYLPKVDFLCSSLMEEQKISFDDISISDFGCGGGHFVHAAKQRGIKALGFDISKDLIGLASSSYRQVYGADCECPFLLVHDEEELLKKLISTESTVVSFIGVLEHLRNPIRFFEAFNASQSKYLYFSVPLFSLSCMIENVFPNIFRISVAPYPPVLTFIVEIYYQQIFYQEVSAWYFGADAMDLRRSMLVSMVKNGCSERILQIFQKDLFSPEILDQMQHVVDNHLAASEVHMLLAKED